MTIEKGIVNKVQVVAPEDAKLLEVVEVAVAVEEAVEEAVEVAVVVRQLY